MCTHTHIHTCAHRDTDMLIHTSIYTDTFIYAINMYIWMHMY